MIKVKSKPFRRYHSEWQSTLEHKDMTRPLKHWGSVQKTSKNHAKSISTVIMHLDSISFAPLTFSIFSILSSFHAVFASSNRTKAFVACWCAATRGSRQTCRGTMAVALGSPQGQRCNKARKEYSSELSLSLGKNFPNCPPRILLPGPSPQKKITTTSQE